MKLLLLFLSSLACFSIFILTNRQKNLTGRATIISRRVEAGKNTRRGSYGSRWQYIVTFRLSDGEEIELYTFENQYKALKEGICGQLTWCGNSFSSFEPDMEVSL